MQDHWTASKDKISLYKSSRGKMGLDNDLDLKKLQEKIREERERVAKLEKEVKETYFVLALVYQN